jgi:hypothetical protein
MDFHHILYAYFGHWLSIAVAVVVHSLVRHFMVIPSPALIFKLSLRLK